MKKSFSIIIIILLLIIASYFLYDIMKNRNILENFESEHSNQINNNRRKNNRRIFNKIK